MRRLDLAIGAASDLGLKRSQNEDSHAIWVPDEPAERERRGVLLLVADGMGGTLAGEVASRLAVETVVRVVREARGSNVLAELRHAIEEANRVVYGKSRTHPDLNGMGTTCTAVMIRGSAAWIAHVGDSRAYLIRDGAIRQLTQDHSLVAQLVEHRELTREQARLDSRRNVVTRSVGVAETVEVDTVGLDTRLGPGDTLLVCSDGLHGQLSDPELAEVLAGRDPSTVCSELIAEANDRGGPDNITVVVARLQESPDSRPRWPFLRIRPGSGMATAGAQALAVNPLLLVLLAATLALACVTWLLSRPVGGL